MPIASSGAVSSSDPEQLAADLTRMHFLDLALARPGIAHHLAVVTAAVGQLARKDATTAGPRLLNSSATIERLD